MHSSVPLELHRQTWIQQLSVSRKSLQQPQQSSHHQPMRARELAVVVRKVEQEVVAADAGVDVEMDAVVAHAEAAVVVVAVVVQVVV